MVERRGQRGRTDRAPGVNGNGTTYRREAPRWLHKHVQLLVVLDALAAAAATLASKALAFGLGSAAELHVRSVQIPYAALMVLSVPAWLVVLASTRCYDVGPFGTGNAEVRRVVSAGAHFLAVMAVAYYVLHLENLGRGFVAAMVPFATGFTLMGRALARYQLRLQRQHGHATRQALVMGQPRHTALLLDHLASHPFSGIVPVLAAVPGGEAELRRQALAPLPGLRMADALADVPDVLAALTTTGADLLIVTGGMTSGELRKLTWRLEGTGVAVMVAPTVAGLAGPRLDVRPVAGLPLLYVDHAALGLDPGAPDEGSATGSPLDTTTPGSNGSAGSPGVAVPVPVSTPPASTPPARSNGTPTA
jgi:FlaA1/EpsC-like NDP-sugar epimerase